MEGEIEAARSSVSLYYTALKASSSVEFSQANFRCSTERVIEKEIFVPYPALEKIEAGKENFVAD